MKALTRILVAEDDPNHVSLIRRGFDFYPQDFELVIADSLDRARELLGNMKPGLLIADLVWPQGSGLELVDYIKQEQLEIPTIIITCRGSEELALRAMKSGIMDYHVKSPETFMNLPRLARSIMERWQQTRQRREAEQRLQDSEKKYRRLTESISDVLWVVDPQTFRYTYVNPAVEQWLGYSPQEVMRQPAGFTMTDESRARLKEILADVRQQLQEGTYEEKGACWREELVFVHKDGSQRWGLAHGGLMKDENNIVGLSGVTQDITDRKNAEENSRKLFELQQRQRVMEKVGQIKEQFLANISHEVRTPMTGIMGMTELLMNTSLNETQKFYLNTIRSSASSLLNIVDHILDLSRLKAGIMELRPMVFDLQAHGRRAMDLFSALLEQKNLAHDFHYDPRLPRLVLADEYRLGQITTNLLSNAIKFTDRGRIRLAYTLVQELKDEAEIRLEVEDTGMGISPEDQEKIFEVFSQVDPSDTRHHEGAGLGLSLIRRMAHLMGGKLGLESTPGQGSRFWMEFGLKKVEGQAPRPAIRKEEETAGPTLPCKVLLVEDKKTNQLVISLMLKQVGCQVDVADHGQQALELFEPGKYNLIIMDIQMPVMDGLTATKELHRRYPKEQVPPVVALSAMAVEGDAEYYIANGLDDYITKPVTAETLRRKVLYWVGRER